MDHCKSLLTNLFPNHDKDVHFDTYQQQQNCTLTTTNTEKTIEKISLIYSETTSKNSTLPYYYDNRATTTPTTIYGNNIKEGIKRYLGDMLLSSNIDSSESSFYVGDLGVLHRQHLKWQALLPRIAPFYGKHAK